MEKLYIETLGCPKNWVESEKLLGQLTNIIVTDDPVEADTIIVNTCSFLHKSRWEAIQTILDLAQYKKIGQCKKLVVYGCLVESHGKELEKELKEVDIFSSPAGVREFINLLSIGQEEIENSNVNIKTKPSLVERQLVNTQENIFDETKRYFLNANSSNYLKIAEGCNHLCTFCTIPQFKGKLKSRPKEELVREAEKMVKKGILEVNLVAQDLTSYGTDLGQENLVSLLTELVKIKGLKWIRLLYLYPTLISDELIHLVKNEDKICSYFDIPMQHLNNDVLKAMGRSGKVEQAWEMIQKIREEISDTAIRTTLIVGFPGETEEKFEDMLKWMEKIKFNHLGIFQYSPEETTRSFHLPNQVEKQEKKHRFKKGMELQSRISSELLRNRIGESYEVLIEEEITGHEDQVNYYLGRSQLEAPDIDGNVVVTSDNKIEVGKWYKVKILNTSEYDLHGCVS